MNPAMRVAILEADSHRAPTADELKAIATAYFMGVCIGELWDLGFSEEDIRGNIEVSFARLKELHGRTTQ